MQTKRILSVALLAATLSISTQVQAEKKYAPGVTDKEIKIGQTLPLSGPATALAVAGTTAAAYFNKINEEGGVNGRKIVFIQLDDAYSPPKTFEQTRKLVEQEGVAFMALTIGAPTSLTVRKYLNEKKVPQILVASSLALWNDLKNYPWSMGWQPSGYHELYMDGEYILKHEPNAKIGFLYQNDESGKEVFQGLKDGLGNMADKVLVKALTFEIMDPTIDSQVVELQSSGANVFLVYGSVKHTAQAIRKVYDIGWRPSMRFVYSNCSSIEQVLKVAGIEKSIGVLTCSFLKDPNSTQMAGDKGCRDYLAFMKKYHPSITPDQLSIYGYSQAQTLVQILKQCRDDLSRENIMTQAANLDMELPMLLPGIKVKTTPNDIAPIKKLRIQRFDGKQYLLLSDN